LNNSTPLIFGEVLFDCFPDGREVLGGAPFNVAWNLQAFGMAPLLISRVGNDLPGKSIREKMASWNMDTSALQTDSSRPTGKVQIELVDDEPRFTILPNQAYDSISPLKTGIKDNKASFLYHGSLALREHVSRNTLYGLKHKYNCPVFVDVNLRQPWWSSQFVHSLIENATWVKMNEDELKKLFLDPGDLEKSCSRLLERYNLDAVFITRGSKGAAAFSRGGDIVTIEPEPGTVIVDTVGAGDAFSSVLLIGLTNGWPMGTMLERAQQFASAVVGLRGAVSEDNRFYLPFATSWNVS